MVVLVVMVGGGAVVVANPAFGCVKQSDASEDLAKFRGRDIFCDCGDNFTSFGPIDTILVSEEPPYSPQSIIVKNLHFRPWRVELPKSTWIWEIPAGYFRQLWE